MLVFLFAVGLTVGVVSGMLGIGGGILVTPLLLYIPSLLGLPSLSMKTITGLTMVQGLVGSASGFLAHRRYQKLNKSLIYWMGPFIVIASFLGAHYSSQFSDSFLIGLFASMALIASILMFVNRNGKTEEKGTFNRFYAVTIASLVGFAGGLVGQGGSFLIVPALITVLGIPTRVALGSNLGIVLMASSAGLLGKWSGGLMEPLYALLLVAGVIPGAQLGGYVSQHIKKNVIKKVLAILILLISLHMWWTIIS